MNFKTNRRISCFGSVIYGFKVCDCLVDVTIGAFNSIGSVTDLWKFYEPKNKYGLGNLFWTYHNNFFIGCFRAHIGWLFSGNYENLLFDCTINCRGNPAVRFEKCCFNLTKRFA